MPDRLVAQTQQVLSRCGGARLLIDGGHWNRRVGTRLHRHYGAIRWQVPQCVDASSERCDDRHAVHALVPESLDC